MFPTPVRFEKCGRRDRTTVSTFRRRPKRFPDRPGRKRFTRTGVGKSSWTGSVSNIRFDSNGRRSDDEGDRRGSILPDHWEWDESTTNLIMETSNAFSPPAIPDGDAR